MSILWRILNKHVGRISRRIVPLKSLRACPIVKNVSLRTMNISHEHTIWKHYIEKFSTIIFRSKHNHIIRISFAENCCQGYLHIHARACTSQRSKSSSASDMPNDSAALRNRMCRPMSAIAVRAALPSGNTSLSLVRLQRRPARGSAVSGQIHSQSALRVWCWQVQCC